MIIEFEKENSEPIQWDTTEFKNEKEWLDAMQQVGKEMLETSSKIDDAKILRRVKGEAMEESAWKKLNSERLSLIKTWRLLAEHYVVIYPKEASFTHNKLCVILAKDHPQIYMDLLEQVLADPLGLEIGLRNEN